MPRNQDMKITSEFPQKIPRCVCFTHFREKVFHICYFTEKNHVGSPFGDPTLFSKSLFYSPCNCDAITNPQCPLEGSARVDPSRVWENH